MDTNEMDQDVSLDVYVNSKASSLQSHRPPFLNCVSRKHSVRTGHIVTAAPPGLQPSVAVTGYFERVVGPNV